MRTFRSALFNEKNIKNDASTLIEDSAIKSSSIISAPLDINKDVGLSSIYQKYSKL